MSSGYEELPPDIPCLYYSTACASGNVHVPFKIYGPGLYIRTM